MELHWLRRLTSLASLGDWRLASLGDWCLASLGDWRLASLGNWSLVSLGDWRPPTCETHCRRERHQAVYESHQEMSEGASPSVI